MSQAGFTQLSVGRMPASAASSVLSRCGAMLVIDDDRFQLKRRSTVRFSAHRQPRAVLGLLLVWIPRVRCIRRLGVILKGTADQSVHNAFPACRSQSLNSSAYKQSIDPFCSVKPCIFWELIGILHNMPPRSEHDLSDTETAPETTGRRNGRFSRGILHSPTRRSQNGLSNIVSTFHTWPTKAASSLKSFDWRGNGRLV